MRGTFPEQFPATENDTEQAWRAGLIVFDTSALLDLYPLSDDAREEVFRLFGFIADQLWLSRHVGAEFFRGRQGMIERERRFCLRVRRSLLAPLAELEDGRRHPFVAPTLVVELRQTKLVWSFCWINK